jgi:hypothetical protein
MDLAQSGSCFLDTPILAVATFQIAERRMRAKVVES